jgi:hypothetical protein
MRGTEAKVRTCARRIRAGFGHSSRALPRRGLPTPAVQPQPLLQKWLLIASSLTVGLPLESTVQGLFAYAVRFLIADAEQQLFGLKRPAARVEDKRTYLPTVKRTIPSMN